MAQHEEIAVSLFRDGTRATARRFQVSLPALDRHKGHLPRTIAQAQQAEVVCEATSLLARVESLMQESEKIAAAAKVEKDWSAATSALREARNCLELLGKLRGELQNGSFHLHAHSDVTATSQPRSEADLDRLIALQVAKATGGFDPVELARLKAVAENTLTQPASA